MKSTELFELLGEIDDKFYEEARIPDEQHGVEVVSEHRPIRGFLGIFLPIAACVAIIAAVVIGADIISKNAGFVGPNNPDSELSSDAPFTSDSGVSSVETSSSTSSEDSSVPVITDNEVIRLEDYPPIDLEKVPDLNGSGFETQMTQQDKKLQKATLETLKCGEYELYMLGEYIHIDKSSDPELLYSYHVKLALAKDGKVLSDDAPHTRSVSMGQAGYSFNTGNLGYIADKKENVYLEYYELSSAPLIIFKYPGELGPDASIGYEATFFSIVDDELMPLMGSFTDIGGAEFDMNTELTPSYKVDERKNTLTDGDLVYTFACENFGKNPYDNAPHFTVSIRSQEDIGFDLSEYPMVDMSEIPDAGDNPNDITNALPKATIAEKQVGEYTLSIIGENLRTSFVIQKDDENTRFMADGVCSVISRDGKVIHVTGENGTGVRTLILTEKGFTDLLPDAYEMKDGIVFGLDKKSVQLPGTPTYGTIKNDVMIEFTTSPLGYDERDPFDGTVSEANGKVTLLPEENALILDGKKYVFDFDKVTYTETVIGSDEINIGDYKPYNENTFDIQQRVILDVKEAAEYRFYLLGHGVRPADEVLVDYDKLFIAVEKNGEIVARVDADDSFSLVGLKISDYLHPFEMKDSMGFVMYSAFEPWAGVDHYAMLYKIENDTITKLKYDKDYAPAPATGSAQYVGGDFKVDFEKNAIVDDKGTITIDFESNTYSRS